MQSWNRDQDYCTLCKGKDIQTPKGPSALAKYKGFCDSCNAAPTAVDRLIAKGKIIASRAGLAWKHPKYEVELE